MPTTNTFSVISASAWAGSTSYSVGDRRTNDSSKVYECITAGTSASSGGPTGTGSDITDGSVHWKYLTLQSYTSLSNWEAGRDDSGDLVSLDTIEVAECYAFEDTTTCTISGWTTSSTNYIEIRCAAGEGHSGVWNTNKYRLAITNGAGFSISEDYVRINGIQVQSVSHTSGTSLITMPSVTAGSNEIRLNNIILRHAASSSSLEIGVHLSAGQSNVIMWNCVIYNVGTYAGSYGVRCYGSSSILAAYSCTVIGGVYPFLQANSGTVTLKNCYAGNGGTNSYSGTMTRTTCAHSSSGTFTGSTANVAVDTTNFTNVTAGSEDFRLPGTGSALYNVGTDTSSDSAPLNFTTDIAGKTRTGTWDIGAFEYVPDSLFFYKPIGMTQSVNRANTY